jgi:CelD/BcsL family acetyltransferase involved in cellulose biosynthesis
LDAKKQGVSLRCPQRFSSSIEAIAAAATVRIRSLMTIATITTSADLIALEPAWSDLWHRDPNATPFQSPHWLLPWWQHFGAQEPFAVAARNADGSLDSLAPLYVLRDDDESLGMLIGTGMTDYLDLLAAPGADLAPLVQTIAGHDCMLWDFQQLRPSEPCPILALAGAGDDLQNVLSTHARKKLRYYRRALARRGAVTVEAATSENLDELLAALYDLHARRWSLRNLPGVLGDDVVQSFHRAVAPRMLAAGALRMYATRIDGRIVAVFYGFAHHGTVYYYLSGYEPELEKLSIGTLLVGHALEQAVRDGATTFDFLRGAEEYKYAWGATDRMNRHRQWIRAAASDRA